MLGTYPAILRDNRLEWSGESPRLPATNRGVRVHVTILEQPEHADSLPDRGLRRAAALERQAASGGVPAIPDPEAWQRETREERPLPGRDDA